MSAVVEHEPAPSAEKGSPVAWVEKRRGKTVGVSQRHRVYDERQTYCLLPLPDEQHRLDLGVAFGVRACKRCEDAHKDEPSLDELVSRSVREVSHLTGRRGE